MRDFKIKNNGVVDVYSAPKNNNQPNNNFRSDRRDNRNQGNDNYLKNTSTFLEKSVSYLGGAAGIAGGFLAIIVGLKKLRG